ncbi:MFS transporter, FHS family, L-fucose permease [Chishuiella changwenlii]|uniref:L-fucose:H+ symporter permease n=1 Tax=Chishuiella changwenlii TaxID=1434701 RepID=A0A1M6UCS1_9FLAO|nr:sugar MFS transporter [Chishuiella changwenlii]GGE99136.1 L-fucose:H+ symporter permease [Chishuiella changwenlii]SHK66976.1 MFS transporter, FHS family, L-fucose permease [Chishuiella changwenlii]
MENKEKIGLTEKKYTLLFFLVCSLFLLWAIAITMGDVLNKHFQDVLHISKAKSGLVQFSMFGAYAIMGIPAGMFLKRYGYKNGVQLGLALYAFGALLFIPASNYLSFNLFRVALFILSAGLATLETVAHPFVAALGNEKTSDQRVNFAQGFNGLGAILGPLLGGFFIFNESSNGLDSVKILYSCIAAFIIFYFIIFSVVKVPNLNDPHAEETNSDVQNTNNDTPLYKQKHFIYAVIAQFFNIGAQAGTWAYFINYTVERMKYSETTASYYFSLSLGLMMIGRFVGTYLMKFIKPNILLAAFTLCNVILCVIIAQDLGMISFVSLISLNFFLSVMYPTIFSLGLKNLGNKVHQASSFLVMAMFGGAVFPQLMGKIAEKNIAHSYYLPIVCYAVILLFALKLYKPKSNS